VLVLVLVLVSVPVLEAEAAEITVKAQPSKTEVKVGETFSVEVKAEGPAGTTWSFPAEIAEEKIELRARASARPVPGQQTYAATVFALSDVMVPSVRVSYTLPDGSSGEVQTEPVKLEIGSLLPRDPKEQQLADIRPPLPLTIGRAFWVTVAIVVAALAALGYWLWRRRRPAGKAAPAAPAVPPDVAARAALDRLAASGRLPRGEYRPFYIELTEIAKRYLEARLEAPVLEMTTTEMLSFLRREARGQGLLDVMRAVSTAADQIKFARGEGAQELALSHIRDVRRMIADLEARLLPAAGETQAPAPHTASRTT
jgi:hypothetical protein